MRKFLLASHAYLAKGMKSSLELILGEQECVDVLCAYTDEQYDIKVEIEKKLTALQPEDELIVITDLFGGSVNNEFTSLLTNTDKKIYLISGMNLVIKNIEDSITALKSGVTDKYKLFIVVESIEDAAKLALAVPAVDKVNLGLVKAKEGTRNISKSINVLPKEEALIREMADAGIEVEIRQVPNDKKINAVNAL